MRQRKNNKDEKEKDNMIITFANQKGGVGKTTLTVAFSNYISSLLENNKDVIGFDFDPQKSFYRAFSEAENIEDSLYNVNLITNDNYDSLINPEAIKNYKKSNDVCIFDLAGTLSKEFTPILKHSDYILVPFNYSNNTLRSTLVFIKFCEFIKSSAKFIFIPNQIDKNSKYLNQPQMDEVVQTIGKLVSPIYKRNALQIIDTIKLSYDHKKAVENTFSEIVMEIWD